MPERCVCCGEIIPEGRQVCPICERNLIAKERAMKVICNECVCKPVCSIFKATGGVNKCEHYMKIVRCKVCEKRTTCRTTNIWAVAPDDDWFCADGKENVNV